MFSLFLTTLVKGQEEVHYRICTLCPFDVTLKVGTLEWSGMRKVGLSKDQEKNGLFSDEDGHESP